MYQACLLRVSHCEDCFKPVQLPWLGGAMPLHDAVVGIPDGGHAPSCSLREGRLQSQKHGVGQQRMLGDGQPAKSCANHL